MVYPLHLSGDIVIDQPKGMLVLCCVIGLLICFVRFFRGQKVVTIGSEVQDHFLSPHSGDLATLLRSRRSVRKYQQRPVTREQLELIVEAARWAPSPHGRQPWRFVVLTREEPKSQLAEHMGETWRENLQMDGQPAQIVEMRSDNSPPPATTAPAPILPSLSFQEIPPSPAAPRPPNAPTMPPHRTPPALHPTSPPPP